MSKPFVVPTRTSGRSARTSVPLHPLLAERWSPRGLDADHELGGDQLAALLEAARWAPSASNTQPWRFAVARRGSDEFAALHDLLAAGNQQWAHAASALLVAAAETVDAEGRPRPWAAYDTGQAVAHLSVQAQHEGLSVHQLGGFDREGVVRLLGLRDGVVPLVVLAVGRHDADADLPEPLASRESADRTRLPLTELVVPFRVGEEQKRAA